MKINFVNLDRQYSRIKHRLNSKIQQVFDCGNFIMGSEVFDLENKLQKYLNIKNAVCCSSGSDALIASLMALGIGINDYVITTSFSFIATADSISMVGAIPVFVDIYPDTFNIDVNCVEEKVKKLGNKCKAIIAVDIFGKQADYDGLRYIADKYNLFLIQDAAQSFGSKYKGKHIGHYSDITTTSFFPTKPLGCYGDGGAIFTNDDIIADKIKSIIQHGKGSSKYQTIRLGFNGRLDTIQAAILLEKLDMFDEELKMRENVVKKYSDKLESVVTIPNLNSNCSWAQYSILSYKRDLIKEYLNENGVPTNIYYPIPLNRQPIYKTGDYLLVCENVCSNILSLPMCPYLIEDEILYISKLILDIINY